MTKSSRSTETEIHKVNDDWKIYGEIKEGVLSELLKISIELISSSKKNFELGAIYGSSKRILQGQIQKIASNIVMLIANRSTGGECFLGERQESPPISELKDDILESVCIMYSNRFDLILK